MKTVFAVPLIFVCSLVVAQDPFRQYDFSDVDLSSIDQKKLSFTIDSIARVTGIDSLRKLYWRVDAHNRPPSRDYGAFVMAVEFGKFSFKTLNKQLEVAGFGRMTETLPSLNVGMDLRTERFLVSWLLGIRVKEKVYNEENSLSIGSAGMVSMHVGYDILNLNRLALYPMVGLSWQKFTMDIRKKNFPHDQSVDYYLGNLYQSSFKQRSLAAQVGVEADVYLSKPDAAFGCILAVRAGYQTTLVNGEFRQHHHGYDFNFRTGKEQYLSVGFKFFSHE